MLRIASLTALLLAVAFAAAGCETKYNQRISRNQQAYKKHPIAVRVHSKYIDEDSPMEYTLRFRNAGSEIVSFDYTVADQNGVPHVDREGPNSGMVKNLYPGATLEVPNPLKLKRVFVTLGTVSYGKKTETEIDAIFRPKTSLAGPASTGSGDLMPDALPQ